MQIGVASQVEKETHISESQIDVASQYKKKKEVVPVVVRLSAAWTNFIEVGICGSVYIGISRN